MLRHIIALPFLLLSLLAAGAPASACAEAARTQECCPNAPNAPCAPTQAITTDANRPDICCVAGSTFTPATAIATRSDQDAEHRDRASTPALLFALITLTTAYVESQSIDELRIVSRPLADSTLYLSTGRLRL
jgi:hypothetical protein